jgi:hypothetical protein
MNSPGKAINTRRNQNMKRRNNRPILRRKALSNRRKGLQVIRRNRNRLARAQQNINRNRRGFFMRRRNYGTLGRRSPRLRIVFVGGLPRNVDNRKLFQLFRVEGRIVGCKIVFNRMGLSKGYGFVEYANPRDAWRSIRKWNNTMLEGQYITVQYRKRRRANNQNIRNKNNSRPYFNQDIAYRRFDQPKRQGFMNGRNGLRWRN